MRHPADSFRHTIGRAHRRCTRRVNFRNGWRNCIEVDMVSAEPCAPGIPRSSVRVVCGGRPFTRTGFPGTLLAFQGLSRLAPAHAPGYLPRPFQGRERGAGWEEAKQRFGPR
jgi:hypothetical protein